MRVIGLTGGIGSGKTTVARMLAERGAVVIDGDDLARQVVLPGSDCLQELAGEFGADVVRADGTLDRGLLAQRAFASADATARLNAITHPRIRAAAIEAIAAIRPGTPLVVLDMPLLVEGRRARTSANGEPTTPGTLTGIALDMVLVVDVPEDLQVARATARGMDEADVRRRMRAQASRQARLEAADVVIDNTGTLAETADQVERVWPRLART